VVKDLNEHALEAKGKTGIEEKGLSETASQHGSTRGRSDEYVTVSEFVAVDRVKYLQEIFRGKKERDRSF